jgi:hypothetical protein
MTHKVDTQHADYSRMVKTWKLCRDLSQGQRAIHEAGIEYLPKLKDESDDDYKARKCRSTLYNAYWRTIAGLTGMLFRKPPVVDADDYVLKMFNDITLTGCSLDDFAQEAAYEEFILDRVGYLVDYPIATQEELSLADYAALNLRPYITMYKAESIINWRYDRVNNEHVLVMVVLVEQHEERENEFEVEYETRYRVLDLFNGAYRQRLFKINDKGEDEVVSEIIPLMNNQPLSYIPFYIEHDIDDPDLIDLADMNIAHYRVTADYEHGCHFTGLPTPIVAGYQKENDTEKLYIGSSSAWVFPDPQAKAFYLEFTGQGLTALENNLNRKEQMMAVLGARMLSPDRKMVESADTASIHRSGENSVLSGIAQELSRSLTRALQTFSLWAGGDEKVSIELNREFLNMPLSAQELTALVGAWQAGAISADTLFFNLKAGETYPDDLTFEEEQAMIDNNPTLSMPTLPTA